MGITKLLHIKESSKGRMNEGLRNAIYYITNPDKTENKHLVGGNCGISEEEILQKFMDTKAEYGKLDGRQGYHYMISFDPEENVSKETCYNVISDFVDEYLNDEYDVVFAVHTDKEHMHGHIIFNSVNSVTGKKYRYEDGDWEKYIQPITDEIAQRYGLKKLEFVRDEEKIDWKQKICNDIESCIAECNSYQEFLNRMGKSYGYKLREGTSQKYGYYISYHPPGKRKAVRSYKLPIECSPVNIKRRIELKNKTPERNIKWVEAKMVYFFKGFRRIPKRFVRYKNMSVYQKYMFKKMMQAKKMYGYLGNPSWQNKRIVRDINKMCRQWNFVLKNNIRTEEDLKEKINNLNHNLHMVNKDLYRLRITYENYLKGNPSVFEIYESYQEMLQFSNPENEEKLRKIESEIEIQYVSMVYDDYARLNNEMQERKAYCKKELRMADSVLNGFNLPSKEEVTQKEKYINNEKEKGRKEINR